MATELHEYLSNAWWLAELDLRFTALVWENAHARGYWHTGLQRAADAPLLTSSASRHVAILVLPKSKWTPANGSTPPPSVETHPKHSNNPWSTSSAPKPNSTKPEARVDSSPKSLQGSYGQISPSCPRRRNRRDSRAAWSARSPSKKVRCSFPLHVSFAHHFRHRVQIC